jgi:hypothetical protein
MFVEADCPWEEHREYTRNREAWPEKLPHSAGPLTVGAMGKTLQTFQNKENSLLPSLTSTRYPLNAYSASIMAAVTPEAFTGTAAPLPPLQSRAV